MTTFEAETEGIRVRATPFHLPAESDPAAGRHVFAYEVEIRNGRDEPARLIWRRWRIHDPVAGDSEVEGEGVVGEQPTLPPGGTHTYRSFCVLRAPEGWMEGSYQFVRPDGSRFDAAIPRFALRAG